MAKMSFHRLSRGAAGLLALALCSPAALAQGEPVAASADGEASILDDGSIKKLHDLEFGKIVPFGSGGTVTIDAETGAVTTAGNVHIVTPGAHRAWFHTSAPDNILMVLSLDPTVTLTRISGTETMDATLRYHGVYGLETAMLFGLPIAHRTTTSGEQRIAVRGTLTVSGTQTPGLYVGQFNFAVAYP